MNEKEKIEAATIDYFIESYNAMFNTHIEKVEHKDKPDFTLINRYNNSTIGVEVATLLFDSDEAKMLLGRSDKKMHSMMACSSLIETLNDRIKKKCEKAKNYKKHDELFLVVRCASPVFDKRSFDIEEYKINISTDNPFDEIWMVFYDFKKQKWGVLKRLTMKQETITYLQLLSEQIRFIKSQQLRISNYSLLMQAGLVSIFRLDYFPYACALICFSVVLASYSVAFIIHSQYSMMKCRKREKRIIDTGTDELKFVITGEYGEYPASNTKFWKDWLFFIPFIIINMIACVIAIIIISK
ncbi:MAG TPA: hypothetical protein PLM53_20315 [Spirochaetota bacterium]|nr:hypothetical protein [Spirochaetota bacterium]HQH99440.1 hypothetical protein [Spirochaetota bacterium]